MFLQLFFLLQVILITNFAEEFGARSLPLNDFAAFCFGLSGFILLNLALFVAVKKLKKSFGAEFLYFFSNLFFIVFFLIFHFGLGAFNFIESQFLFSLASLALYLGALKGLEKAFHPNHRFKYVKFLLPFCIPYLVLALFLDLTPLFGLAFLEETIAANPYLYLLMLAGILLFAFLILLFLSPVLIYFWECQPMENSFRHEKLSEFCNQVGFKHGGFKVWNLFNQSYTAGIIGILPPFRYILFTRPILRFPSETLIAILTHEMGHARHKHLMLYPLVLFLLIFLSMALTLLIFEPFQHLFALYNLSFPSQVWEGAFSLSILLPNLILMLLYLRFVFGFFSRKFERQADLYCFEIGGNPMHMVDALDKVANFAKIPHTAPSWHHYSIDERMRYLLACIEEPSLILRHHFRTKRALALHFCLTAFVFAYLFFTLFPDNSPTEAVSRFNGSVQTTFKRTLSTSFEKKLASKTAAAYGLQGNESVKQALQKGFETFGGARFEGIAEFYAAQSLAYQEKYSAAYTLLIGAWKQFPFDSASEEVKDAFMTFSFALLVEKEKVEQTLSDELEKILRNENANP